MAGISTSPWFFLLLSNVIFVIFGAVLEGLPAMIVFVPVMYPIAMQFGIDPLHYGILIIASIGIGVFLPPIGVGALHRLRHRQAEHRGLHEIHGPLSRHPLLGAAGDHLRPLVHAGPAAAVPAAVSEASFARSAKR